MKKKIITMAVAIMIAVSLQSCAVLVIGGTAAAVGYSIHIHHKANHPNKKP